MRPPSDMQTLRNTQQQFLEALRHREQEVFRYLAIIGPALGGFIWMLSGYGATPRKLDIRTFSFGTLGLILLLLLGAWYCVALGYNYRYLTFQLMKIEKALNISPTLHGWPRRKRDMMDRSKLGHYVAGLLRNRRGRLYRCPLCFPPGLIGVFWWAFIIGIAFLTIAGAWALWEFCWWAGMTIGMGTGSLISGLIGPMFYGRKFRRFCVKASGYDPERRLLGLGQKER